MIKYFISGFLRNIWLNRTHYSINIFGLAIGLSISFVVLIYVLNETSYDDCHIKKNRIYRVLSEYPNWKELIPNTPFILAPTLSNEFPEIENCTRIKKLTEIKIHIDNSFISEGGFQFADNSIFEIFSLPFIIGNPKEALNQNNNVVISEKMAKKYFNSKNPIGKILSIDYKGREYDLLVTGVMQNIPQNSTFQADFIGNIIIPINYLKERFKRDDIDKDWRNIRFNTYVLLKQNVSIEQLQSKLIIISEKYSLENFKFIFKLQNLTDIYLKSTMLTSNNTKTGSLSYIYIFSFISILILVISGSNSIILYIAQSSTRYKEFGIRKVFGSNINLIKQIYTESILLNFLALPIAIVILILFYPYFDLFFNDQIFIATTIISKYIIGFVIITLAIGIISGIYVSIYFSKINTIETLKNKLALGKKKLYFNRVLVIFQIIIFSGLFATLIYINRQVSFVENKSMGFNEDGLIIIEINPDEFKDYSLFKHELKNISSVLNVTGGWGVPPNNEDDHDLIPAGNSA